MNIIFIYFVYKYPFTCKIVFFDNLVQSEVCCFIEYSYMIVPKFFLDISICYFSIIHFHYRQVHKEINNQIKIFIYFLLIYLIIVKSSNSINIFIFKIITFFVE